MLTISLNGDPCALCGHDVRQLTVNVPFTRQGRHYRVNVTHPCGCVHGVREVAKTADHTNNGVLELIDCR